jgi:uncharacterized protein YgiM (DUF1202 family)
MFKKFIPMKRLTFSFVWLFVLVEIGVVRAETTLWVKTPNTVIRLSKSASSPEIAKLKRGTPVVVVSEEGKWKEVRLPDGKIGWVFRFKLTEEKPEDDWGLFESMNDLFEKPTVEEASTSASIRGLSKISENHARRQKTKSEHIQSVKEMEQFPISQQEISRFLREGKLGEYGQ